MHRTVAVVALLAAALLPGRPAHASLADDLARERARGNRLPAATALATALLRAVRPAQIVQVRVDGVGPFEVAGVVVSGVKFHRPLDAAQFSAEIAGIVRETFAASAVQEVDVWAVAPLRVGEHAVVAGDKASPTTKIVFAATVRRADATAVGALLRAGRDVFWDPAWKAGLGAPGRTQSERVSQVRPR